MPVMNGAQFAERYWAQRTGDGNEVTGERGETGVAGMAGKTGESRRPEGRAPPVVFAATAGLTAAEEAERLRAVGFLTKPFELDDLLSTVERCARLAHPVDQAKRAATGRRASRSRAEAKGSGTEMALEQLFRRLQMELATLTEDLARVRERVEEVRQVEQTRRLTREETQLASRLRMESERLRYELQLLRSEFYRLKDRSPTA